MLSQPPLVEGKCDGCHGPLVTREDDEEAVIRRRLVAYKEQTGPILQWYGGSAVQTVNGAQAPEAVRTAIEIGVLERMHSTPTAK